MEEIALHILDIVQNSIVACANLISIEVEEDYANDRLIIIIVDNGKGIEKHLLDKVADPFYTKRTTRKVGLGLSLLKQSAEMAGGSFSIESEINKGTTVKAIYQHSHIDRQPLGDIPQTISILVASNPDINFTYKHKINNNSYYFDTRQIKEVLEEVPITSPEVRVFIHQMLKQNIDMLNRQFKEI
ncbi:MAG TPA: ATP-binding protein [Bacteroidales bacterium]|nr:ATP-binding protein [Bacteroidales bacterium]